MPLPTDKKQNYGTVKPLYSRVAFLGILGALAIVLSIMENVIMPALPFMPPGAKPGLSNIVMMFAACTLGWQETLLIVVFKSLFVLITRGGSAFLMSISGGLLSSLAALILIRMNLKNISLIGISVVAAVVHNIGQLLMSALLTHTLMLLDYLPLLMIFGVVSGVITGVIVSLVIPAVCQVQTHKYFGGVYGEKSK